MTKQIATCIASMLLLTAARAQENAYDLLGKALMPVANVFAPGGENRALVLDAHLVEAGNLPPELQGQAAHIAVAPPDELLVQAPIAGETLTVCRDGDSLWVAPGSKVQAILDQLGAGPAAGSRKNRKHKSEAARLMGPLVLPVPQKDLVFLPILFQARDAGEETIGATPCRVLDAGLMPELARSLKAEGWSARVWIATATHAIVKLDITGPDWHGVIAIDKLAFPAVLPEATFQPPQGADVLRLTANQFAALLERVGRK